MSREGCTSRRKQPVSIPDSLNRGSFIEVSEDDDGSTLPLQTTFREVLTVQQYIVYSATFQVPAFYFTVHDRSALL